MVELLEYIKEVTCMHALHRILVNLEKIDITQEYLQNNREGAIDCIKDYADSETQDFYGTVFDWRETTHAGGWSGEFPENVLLGSEKSELLLQQIQLCQELQKEEINSNLKFIEEDAGSTLADIVYFVSKEPIKSLGSLCSLKIIANLLSGNYCFDSYFYNIDDGTSRINDNTFEKVKQSPEKWALVLFDYHI